MRLLIVQHAETEHSGRLRALLTDDGITPRVVVASQVTNWPDLDDFDALWVLGGGAQVWQSDLYPWLVDEIAFIKRTVEVGKPYLGICLGHQLLAVATDGRVGPSQVSEIGVMPVTINGNDAFLAGAANPFDIMMWHSAEVTALPRGMTALAHSDACAVQAMRGGPAIVSVQFHPETDDETFASWLSGAGARDALVDSGDVDTEATICAALINGKDALQNTAATLYQNWMSEAHAVLATKR